MTDTAQAIVLALMVLIGCLVLWALFQNTSQCHAVDGTVVRGFFWLECIQ